MANVSNRKTTRTTLPYRSKRFLILTADDFGASKNINEGIIFAAEKKALTSISVLANFTESLPDLKKLSENHSGIGIGVHLNIVTGNPLLGVDQVPSLVSDRGSFYTIDEILPKISSISIDEIRKELRAQILVMKKYDIRIDNLSDQYGILFTYSPFFNVIVELAKEFNLPVRSPVLASVKYPGVLTNSNMVKEGRKKVLSIAFKHPFKAMRLKKYFGIREMERKAQMLDEFGIPHPDLFIGSLWGDPTASNLIDILEHLPEGTSEIVFHYGSYTRQENYPSGLDLDYFRNREYELMTGTSDYLKEYMSYLNIEKISFSQLPTSKNI